MGPVDDSTRSPEMAPSHFVSAESRGVLSELSVRLWSHPHPQTLLNQPAPDGVTCSAVWAAWHSRRCKSKAAVCSPPRHSSNTCGATTGDHGSSMGAAREQHLRSGATRE